MTEIRRNLFKAAIKEFRLQQGIWCTIGDSLVAEMLADCGYDWLMFDTEHSAIDTMTVLPLLQAVAPYTVEPIVRPTSLNLVEIKKLLDFGAQTILVPFVQNAAEANQAVTSVTYPPNGIRGVSGVTRATRFGRTPAYQTKARDEICLIVQVETRSALHEIEQIASVPGVDAIFVGPSDLAASLGFPGQPNSPVVREAVLDAIRRIRRAGLPPGILTVNEDLHDAAIEAGAVFVSKTIDIVALRKAVAL